MGRQATRPAPNQRPTGVRAQCGGPPKRVLTARLRYAGAVTPMVLSAIRLVAVLGAVQRCRTAQERQRHCSTCAFLGGASGDRPTGLRVREFSGGRLAAHLPPRRSLRTPNWGLSVAWRVWSGISFNA